MAKETYCFFSAQYLPTLGGVERYTFNMAKELIKRGNKVIVVTCMLPGQSAYDVDDFGIKIFRVPAFLLLSGRMPISFPKRDWKQLCNQLNTLNITRIIIQTRLYTLSLMGMKYARNCKIPFITIEHGTSYVGIQNPFLRFCERRYENILLRFAKKWCQKFYCVSQAGVDWLQNLGIQAEGILYNSVDDVAIHNYLVADSSDIRAEFGLDDDAVIVSFIGRLIPEKGIVQLTEAIGELANTNAVYLFIAGDGPLYYELKIKKYPNVFLLGALPQPKVMPLLSQSNIFCLPSDSEGFPTSVLEAVLCHCYVITTSFGGAKELISSEEYGKIINNNSKQIIKESICSALSSSASCKIAADKAYQRFYLYFTWEKICNTLENITWGDV